MASGALEAGAATAIAGFPFFSALGAAQFTAISLTLGALAVGVTSAVLLVRIQRRAWRVEAQLEAEAAELRDRLDDAEALLVAEAAVMIRWESDDVFLDTRSDAATAAKLPSGTQILSFGTWLSPEFARTLDEGVKALRGRGEAFSTTVRSKSGIYLLAEGKIVGGRAVLRFRNVTADRRARAQAEEQQRDLESALRLVYDMLDALDQPIWIRDTAGRLAWTNAAYARAVEAAEGSSPAADGTEFLDSAMRAEIEEARQRGEVFRRRLPAVVAGTRRIFDVVDIPSGEGSAGLALDVSDVEALRADLSRRIESHRRTLDELATAVAIFRADGVLAFHNQAYRQLWGLDDAFLDQAPTDSAILDKLRAANRLPEQQDFRSWKEALHEGYRSLDPRDHWWHLPDGRTVRVVANPNPEGGVTYLFEDVTERIGLESRYNALTRVQSETLDHLAEAVAVFGSDGRLKLFNPAFERLWQLRSGEAAGHPHASDLLRRASELYPDPAFWERMRVALTAVSEQRTRSTTRIEREDDRVLDVAVVPLPDGATMLTFSDVTAAVQIERALRDRNEALETAAQLKSDFVNHVSYELRTPLTNIIGFTQLLGKEHVGTLNEKQREYAEHVLQSSEALLAIIDDILDLATVDAGVVELKLEPVDIRSAMEAAAEGVRDRLAERGLRLEIRTPDPAGTLDADSSRLRQILFNILSNAIAFSPPGSTVSLEAERTPREVVFRVRDEGTGIPPELLERVFERFESRPPGHGRKGVGLGLSIVRSFVELHGGSVAIQSNPGRGTVVTCRFPTRPAIAAGTGEIVQPRRVSA